MRGNNMTWLKLFKRKSQPLVFSSTFWEGQKYYTEVTGIPTKLPRFRLEDYFIYCNLEEYQQELNKLRKIYTKDEELFSRIVDKITDKGENLLSTLKSLNYTVKSKSELKEQFKKYCDAINHFSPIVWVCHRAEAILTEIINQKLKKIFPSATKEELIDLFNTLTFFEGEVSAIQERKSLLKLACELKEKGKINAELQKKLDKHYKKYAYLGAVDIGWSLLTEPYSKEYFEKLLNELAADDPINELTKIEKKKKELKHKYTQTIKRPEIAKELELIRKAKLLGKYMFLRTYRGECFVKAEQLAKPLLIKIGNQFNLSLEGITYLLPNEIISLLEIEERKQGFGFETDKNYGVRFWIAKPKQKQKLTIRKILGKPACKGIVSGTVKVIKDRTDIKKIEKGDILVTQMTSPDITIVFNKIAAIVTDEGGILCHAAIVSREYGIPCIIGTKIATKVLEDGDLVKVDADKGIVEKIRNKSIANSS